MWVAPEARGTGLGDALVEAVIAWGAAHGRTAVKLEVAVFNTPAIRLYQRHGFVVTGARRALPAPRQDTIEMEMARPLGGV